MAKVGDSAHTDHGLGTITEVDSIRGSRSFRVAGRGFDVWVPELKLHVANQDFYGGLDTTIEQGDTHDYPVTYPYDPSPQYPVDLFRKEQTILPGDYEIDPEDRLHPSDESGKRVGPNRPYPGPNPDLFAKGASVHHGEFEDAGENFKEWGEDDWHSDLPDGSERTFGKDATYRPAGLDDRYAHIPDDVDARDPIVAFRQDPLGYMERHAYAMTAGEEERLLQKFADEDNLLSVDKNLRTAAWNDVRTKAQRLRHEGKVHVNHVSPQHIYATVDGDNGVYDTMIVKGASGAFTGGQAISNWYCDCDWGKWAFQRKASYVGRLCSHAYATYLDMQSHYHKDNGGKFKAASIVDDFKSWAKENNDGHLDEGSMSDFINTCEKKVSKEEAAQLYDHLLTNAQAAPERDYKIPYTLDNEEAYKTADVDALRQRPLSLSPDLRVVPGKDENQWTDVTKDERETTGPEQIVHFGAIASMLHTADGDDSGGLWSPKTWFGDAGAGIGNALLHPENLPGYGAGSDFIDQHNVQKHPELLNGGGQPKQPAAPVSAVSPAPPAPGAGGQPGPGAPAGGKGNFYQQNYPNAFKPGPGAPPAAPGGGAPLQGPHAPGQAVAPTPKGVQPDGSWQHSLDTTGTGGGSSYTVKPGDTLGDIAQRSGLGGNYQDLAKSNNIADPNMIQPGQKINLPGQPSSGPANAASQVPGVGAAGISESNASQVPGAAGAGVTETKPPAAPQPPAVPKLPTAPGVGQANNPNNPMKALQLPGQQKTQSRQNLAALLHYAENDDDDKRLDTGEAAGKLDRLRELGDENPSDHYQHMDDYNDEVRDLVEELQDAGVDAMPFVAARHGISQSQRGDDDPSDGDANFAGRSSPNWADEPFNGSGPDPKLWSSDSASYVDEHERPDFTDVTDLPDGDIIKFNDSRSKPQQGPRHGNFAAMLHQGDLGAGNTIGDLSAMNGSGVDLGATVDPLANGAQSAGEGTVASRHHAYGDDSGMFNPNNPTENDWEEGSGRPFMNEVGHATDQFNPLHGGGGDGADEGAEGGEGAGLAEEAPELLALAASRQAPGGGFSLEAFDQGGFSFDDLDGGGELRRAARLGGGPVQEVRVDHGARGWEKEAQTYNPPEGFGNDGDPDLAAYDDPGVHTAADVVSNFQRSAGALAMMHGQGSESAPRGSLDDFSSSPMVQKMLRTAGRKFTPAEEADLEGEEHHLGARNLPTQDELAGTHYLMGL